MKSSSKCIIISDIHNRIYWIEDFLKNTPHDKVVFLGDYFDSFYDTPDIAEKTARWLKYSLSISNRVHLYGNHDCPYARSMNEFARCPGFDHDKNRRINHILDRNDWNKLKFVEVEQNWLLSHAGAHPSIFSHPIHGPSLEWIVEYCNQGMEAFNSNIPHPVYQYSAARGMSRTHDVGGINWLDWNHEFVAIENVNQIVGHTICTKWVPVSPIEHSEQSNPNFHAKVEVFMSEPKTKFSINSKNWNIDCNNKIIGIIENGEFSWIPNTHNKLK